MKKLSELTEADLKALPKGVHLRGGSIAFVRPKALYPAARYLLKRDVDFEVECAAKIVAD